jgi:demethylmenaquinone methyltransferase/2-methoxy-6-polyprenyl-1,4-benzoquinol methylase
MRSTALRLFGGLAQSYDTVLDWATLFQDRYWKRWVVERIPDMEGGLELDVGCGTLVLEERLSGYKCRFVGLDLTKEMLKLGQRKRIPNVALLVRGDAEDLPFSDSSFDSVVSCYVAKYVDVHGFTRELARVAKPGAAVALYDFARPRGLLAPFLELYIQAGLRALGSVLSLLGSTSAFAFGKLPAIVDQTRWDGEMVESMEKSGFETTFAGRLTGGVVFAYSGRKRECLYGA